MLISFFAGAGRGGAMRRGSVRDTEAEGLLN